MSVASDHPLSDRPDMELFATHRAHHCNVYPVPGNPRTGAKSLGYPNNHDDFMLRSRRDVYGMVHGCGVLKREEHIQPCHMEQKARHTEAVLLLDSLL